MTDPSSDRDLNALSGAVVDAAFAVHKTLGPGLLESVYDACLSIEFRHRGIPFSRQRDVPIIYRDTPIEAPLRLDFVIAEKLILEIKAVEKLLPLFDAQLLTYLKLTGLRLGLLINFNTTLLKQGIRRIAH